MCIADVVERNDEDPENTKGNKLDGRHVLDASKSEESWTRPGERERTEEVARWQRQLVLWRPTEWIVAAVSALGEWERAHHSH